MNELGFWYILKKKSENLSIAQILCWTLINYLFNSTVEKADDANRVNTSHVQPAASSRQPTLTTWFAPFLRESHKHTNTQTQIHIYKHKYTNANTRTQIHKHKYTNANTQTQIHKRKYTNTHIRIHKQIPLMSSCHSQTGAFNHLISDTPLFCRQYLVMRKLWREKYFLKLYSSSNFWLPSTFW